MPHPRYVRHYGGVFPPVSLGLLRCAKARRVSGGACEIGVNGASGNSDYGMCGKRRCVKRNGHRTKNTEHTAAPMSRIP